VTEDKARTDTLQKLKTTQKKQTNTKRSKMKLASSLLMTLGQETKWAYSTMLPSPHRVVGGEGLGKAKPHCYCISPIALLVSFPKGRAYILHSP